MNGLIKQLKQFITGIPIFPITKTNAVYDDTVGRLDTFMQGLVAEADILESDVKDTPRDADTLGGHLPSYFAKQSDLLNIISNSNIQRVNGTSFASVLINKENEVVFIAFNNASDNPFSFASGYCIAMQSSLLTGIRVFQLIGINDSTLEVKRITIST